MDEDQDGLAIGDLARQAGVPAPTLRSWEGRYGFPSPRRLAGGHRRYDGGDIAIINDVLRLRAAGMSLPAAISQATARTGEIEQSVFASLRRQHPDLVPQVLRKATLLALTRAIEDECCARAEQATLFASFQHQRYYRSSEDRWNELARTSQLVVAFADFGDAAPPTRRAGPSGRSPLKVPLPVDAPLRREWTLICQARDYPACVSGWEFPGQHPAADASRRFEVIWSADPQVVRTAASTCTQLAEFLSPGLDLPAHLPSEPPSPASGDLHRAVGLLNRMTGYLDRATRP